MEWILTPKGVLVAILNNHTGEQPTNKKSNSGNLKLKSRTKWGELNNQIMRNNHFYGYNKEQNQSTTQQHKFKTQKLIYIVRCTFEPAAY